MTFNQRVRYARTSLINWSYMKNFR